MDKDRLIDLISTSLISEACCIKAFESKSDIKNYLIKLNLNQLRTISKEFIL